MRPASKVGQERPPGEPSSEDENKDEEMDEETSEQMTEGMVQEESGTPGPPGSSTDAPPTAARGVRKDAHSGKSGRRRGKSGIDKEIRELQGSATRVCIPKGSFCRLVKEMSQMFQDDEPFRFTTDALLLIQSATEEYLTYLFADSYLCTVHRKRLTLQPEDLRLVRRLRAPHCWQLPA